MSKSTPKKLTPQQMRFVVAYTTIGSPTYSNATASARAAQYSPGALAQAGYRLLHTPAVEEAIKAAYQRMQAPADEALAMLSSQMRANIAPFVTHCERPVYDEHGEVVSMTPWLHVDVAGMRNAGLGHLIKSIKHSPFGPCVEFHDAQAAADKILRAGGAYKDKFEPGEVMGALRVLRDFLHGDDTQPGDGSADMELDAS